MKQKLGIFGVAVLAACSTNGLIAQTSTSATGEFSLQGQLTNTSGSPVADGEHTITMNIYARGSGGLMYTESDRVTTMNGIFSTMVGDNGNNGSRMMVDLTTEYELGIAVDDGTELSPRLRIADAVSAIRAKLAANANAVNGFRVDSTGTGANSIVTTDGNGRIRSSQFGRSIVTSVNGLSGDVNLQISGNGVTTDTTGGVLRVIFTGGGSGGGGDMTFPYAKTLTLPTGDVFSLSNGGSGAVAAFTNSGSGPALRLSGSSASDATLRVQNRSGDGSARTISSMNSSGTPTFEVMADGRTTINSAMDNALEVTSTATDGTALKVNGELEVNGELRLNGPIGSGSLNLLDGSVTINNPLVKSDSFIMLTVTSASNGATVVPLRVSSQGNGSFTVAAIPGLLNLLSGNVSFNYLVVNK